MKKLFLSLLAAIGMVAGFTLSSCGGGGGSDKSISGMLVQGGPGIPAFMMNVGEQKGDSNQYETEYTFGSSVYSGTFNLVSDYPTKNDEENTIIIKGEVGINDSSCLTDPEFMAWISGKNDALSVQISKPIVLTITVAGNDSGTMVREVEGLYYYKTDASFPLETPVIYNGLYINANRLRKAFGIDDK